MIYKEIVLGKIYEDEITGFVGVATAKAEYLDGMPNVRLTSTNTPEKPVELWIPIARVMARNPA